MEVQMMKIQNKDKIFVTIVLTLSILLSIKINYKYADSFIKERKAVEEALNECQTNTSLDPNYINYCKRMEELDKYKEDFFSSYSSMVIFELKFLNPCAFLFISIPTLYIIYKRLKYGYFINVNNRETYKRSLKSFFRDAYRYIWVLPAIALIFMIPILFYTTLNPSYAIKYGSCLWANNLIKHPFLFLSLYLFNLILYAGLFINISLIVVRKKHNFISAVILSYLLYVALELFNEVFINVILFQRILHTSNGGLFNIMNMFTFNTQYGTCQLILFTLVVYLISVLVVYFSYKDHEKLIIDCEKNNPNGGKV